MRIKDLCHQFGKEGREVTVAEDSDDGNGDDDLQDEEGPKEDCHGLFPSDKEEGLKKEEEREGADEEIDDGSAIKGNGEKEQEGHGQESEERFVPDKKNHGGHEAQEDEKAENVPVGGEGNDVGPLNFLKTDKIAHGMKNGVHFNYHGINNGNIDEKNVENENEFKKRHEIFSESWNKKDGNEEIGH